jgi:DNA repair protein RadD
MLELRPYQLDAVQALYNWFANHETGNPLLVLPTGSGKSLVQAKVCEDAMQFANQRILLLTHVRELVSQNYSALLKLLPEANVGIYSAGLNKRQAHNKITFASIQSVYKKSEVIGWRDLILIDEAHLISDSDSGMYRTFLSGMQAINPGLRVIGLSATPYRLRSGYLHTGEDAIFSDIAYDLPLTKLVKDKFLSPLISKGAIAHGETDKLAIQAGEFSIKEALNEFDNDRMTNAAIKELLSYGAERKTWLIFCITIDHAEHVRDKLNELSIKTETISERTPKPERDSILSAFKNGNIRAITNVSVLTTGFDAPNIDMICLLRPTMSPGLLTQMCGRGMRLSPGKENCLILDFAQNFERHGPITHIVPQDGSRKKKEIREGKICPKCQSVCAVDQKECEDCGYIFEGHERKIKHATKASSAAPMSNEPVISEIPQWFKVLTTTYEPNIKFGQTEPSSLRVMYKTPHAWVSEWVCFGHEKQFPRKKAEEWWMVRGGRQLPPTNVEEALGRMEEIDSTRVARIKVKKDGSWIRILAYDFVKSDKPMVFEEGNMNSKVIQSTEEREHDIAF